MKSGIAKESQIPYHIQYLLSACRSILKKGIFRRRSQVFEASAISNGGNTQAMSSRAFVTQFHEFSRRKHLIEERDRIIAAVSGGADSMVLLDLLAKEQESFGLTVIVAHFNFGLRGAESDGDEALVARMARHYGFELYVEHADTEAFAQQHRVGIQEAARILRYEFFDKLLLSSGFDKIATAHNADDNVETIMMNLFRGSGVTGLAGIPVYREDRRIIRPLLFAERSEIEAYAVAEHLTFRIDSSNEKEYYTRNFVRHRILPLIKEEVNPGVVSTMSRSAELFRELDVFLRETARAQYQSVVVFDSNEELHLSITKLRTIPKLIQHYIVMMASEAFSGTKLEYDKVSRVLDLTEGLTGSRVEIDKNSVVYRDRDHLIFRRVEEKVEFRFAVLPAHRYRFERFEFSSEILETRIAPTNGRDTEYIDADKVEGQELIIRSWREGDWFIPLGMTSRKKLSDFFVDAKIPVFEKPFVPILETKGGDIVWVCGYRIDERFKVTMETRRVMKLHFSILPKQNAPQQKKSEN